jgi:hypothetical protein
MCNLTTSQIWFEFDCDSRTAGQRDSPESFKLKVSTLDGITIHPNGDCETASSPIRRSRESDSNDTLKRSNWSAKQPSQISSIFLPPHTSVGDSKCPTINLMIKAPMESLRHLKKGQVRIGTGCRIDGPSTTAVVQTTSHHRRYPKPTSGTRLIVRVSSPSDSNIQKMRSVL